MTKAFGKHAAGRLSVAGILALTVPALMLVAPAPADAAEDGNPTARAQSDRAAAPARSGKRKGATARPAARERTAARPARSARSGAAQRSRGQGSETAARPFIHMEGVPGESQQRSRRGARSASDDGRADIVTGAGTHAPRGNGGFRQEPGTTVPTADDIKAPEKEGEAALLLPAVQAARASSQGGEEGGVEPSWKVEKGEAAEASGSGGHVRVIDGSQPPARAGLSQNGTTVATADEVLAPETNEGRLVQNGTTVATADEVLAPEPKEARLVQNGTTVATADELLAPENARGKMSQNGTTVETASEVQAPSGR
ncbi:hypothetical protein [Qipengyuania vesicularis]|uniref:hypothetical protein n=1 Tax=Qipengyuania vesicularis TaxID=2867232 RepID=UPI001C86CE67|nr:hypothetical protein [Qipengyuania vesicularis]MBX7528544.1 hypothetical protein [Qipengyuania vesicularis]